VKIYDMSFTTLQKLLLCLFPPITKIHYLKINYDVSKVLLGIYTVLLLTDFYYHISKKK